MDGSHGSSPHWDPNTLSLPNPFPWPDAPPPFLSEPVVPLSPSSVPGQLFCKCATVPALGRDLSLSLPVSLQGQALVSALGTLWCALWVDIDLRALPQLERGGERVSSGQAAVPLERDSSLQTSGRPFCPEDLQHPALAEECPGSSVDLAGGKQRPAFSVSENPSNIPKNKGLSL